MAAKGWLKMAYIWQHFVVLLIFRVKTAILRRLHGACDQKTRTSRNAAPAEPKVGDAQDASPNWGTNREKKLPPHREQFTGLLCDGVNVSTNYGAIISKNANDVEAVIRYELKIFLFPFFFHECNFLILGNLCRCWCF